MAALLEEDNCNNKVASSTVRTRAIHAAERLSRKLSRRLGFLPASLAVELEEFINAFSDDFDEVAAAPANADNETGEVYARLFNSKDCRWRKGEAARTTRSDFSMTRRSTTLRLRPQQQEAKIGGADEEASPRVLENGRYKPRIRPPVPIQVIVPQPKKKKKKKKRKKRKLKRRRSRSNHRSREIVTLAPTVDEEVGDDAESNLEQAEYLRALATDQMRKEEQKAAESLVVPPQDPCSPSSPTGGVATQDGPRDLLHASVARYTDALRHGNGNGNDNGNDDAVGCFQARCFLGRAYAYRRLGNAKRALLDLDMVINLLVEDADQSGLLEDPEDEAETLRFPREQARGASTVRPSALWNMKGHLLLQAGLPEEGLASLLHALRLEGPNGSSSDRFREEYALAYRHVRSGSQEDD